MLGPRGSLARVVSSWILLLLLLHLSRRAPSLLSAEADSGVGVLVQRALKKKESEILATYTTSEMQACGLLVCYYISNQESTCKQKLMPSTAIILL